MARLVLTGRTNLIACLKDGDGFDFVSNVFNCTAI